MNRLLRRIELIANVCIIAVALVICAALVKRFLLKSPSTASPAPGVATGTKITLPDVDWAKNGKTLLLVLSTGCKFCSASAPFYQHLASNAMSQQQGAKLIAVLPQGVEQSREYLKSLNVTIDDVKQASPPALGVRATPTLILVNNTGLVTDTWVGQLSADKEAEVFARLQ
jgi:hypothetical protein